MTPFNRPRSNARIWKIARIRYGERVSDPLARSRKTRRRLFQGGGGGGEGREWNTGKEKGRREKKKQEEMQKRDGVRYAFLSLPGAKIEFKASGETIDHHPPSAPALSHFNSSFSSRDDAYSSIGSLWPLPFLSLSPSPPPPSPTLSRLFLLVSFFSFFFLGTKPYNDRERKSRRCLLAC